MDNFPRPFNDDYELLGVLGKGGMGSHVYKARQIKLDRIVALKVLDRDGDSEAEKRFYSEAQSMRELNHQNLVTVYDFGVQGDKIFIAMTFVDGESLSEIIKREKILPVKTATYVALQIAKGLEYAHDRKIIHRDIKPSNIMIKKNWDVCIIDFGISITGESKRLTSTGMTMGTPEYMSPEQCQNRNLTLQSDIYNLGILFYEMLSGDPPFTSGAALAILNKHLHEKPASLRKKNSKVPLELERIIDKCLEKKMENRYANFSEFAEDIKELDSDPKHKDTKKTLIKRLSKLEQIIFLILCVLPILSIVLMILLTFKIKNVPEAAPALGYLIPKSSNIENNIIQGDSLVHLIFDGDPKTAWIIPKDLALRANNRKLVTINFPKPALITNIGIAIGDQSSWDNFQKYNKSKEILIYYTNPTVSGNPASEVSGSRTVSLENKLGVQYPSSWVPIEVNMLTFELRSMQNPNNPADFAISEIRIIGVEVGP
ncbi:MAG: serine/threonine protein kinase [Fibromonadaceae bacterium]|jgi:serine/threonine protein kinase|nr:serine/threonine protein kinase [Fibromonadaceae bacterium]